MICLFAWEAASWDLAVRRFEGGRCHVKISILEGSNGMYINRTYFLYNNNTY